MKLVNKSNKLFYFLMPHYYLAGKELTHHCPDQDMKHNYSPVLEDRLKIKLIDYKQI